VICYIRLDDLLTRVPRVTRCPGRGRRGRVRQKCHAVRQVLQGPAEDMRVRSMQDSHLFQKLRWNTTHSAWRLQRRLGTGQGRAGRTGTSATLIICWGTISKDYYSQHLAIADKSYGNLWQRISVAGELFRDDRVPHAVLGDCRGGVQPGGRGPGVREPWDCVHVAAGLFQGH
jgi:hypothetical protein